MTAIHISTFERKVMLITYITTASFVSLFPVEFHKNCAKMLKPVVKNFFITALDYKKYRAKHYNLDLNSN